MFTKRIVFVLNVLTLNFSSYALAEQEMTEQHKAWLKNEFAAKHQAIIPKVAVADMFYGCNLVRKIDPVPYQIPQLIKQMDKGLLAEKLNTCLNDETPQSENALNYGLVGCFTDQFSELPAKEQAEKLALVQGAIRRLSREQRQRSFTKCVTEQAIKYIQ